MCTHSNDGKEHTFHKESITFRFWLNHWSISIIPRQQSYYYFTVYFLVAPLLYDAPQHLDDEGPSALNKVVLRTNGVEHEQSYKKQLGASLLLYYW